MNVKKLGQPAMNDWVGSLIQQHQVYAPQAKADRFAYDRLRCPGTCGWITT